MVNIDSKNELKCLSRCVCNEIKEVFEKDVSGMYIVRKGGGIVFKVELGYCGEGIGEVSEYFRKVYGIDCDFKYIGKSLLKYRSRVVEVSELGRVVGSMLFEKVEEVVYDDLVRLIGADNIEVHVYRDVRGKYIIDVAVLHLGKFGVYKKTFSDRYGVRGRRIRIVDGGERYIKFVKRCIMEFNSMDELNNIVVFCKLCR